MDTPIKMTAMGACLLTALLGCADLAGPQAELRYAQARRTCGFSVGWATLVILAPGPPAADGSFPLPNVTVMIQRPQSPVTGSWPVTNGGQNAVAVYSTQGQFEVGYFGRISIDRIGADSTMEGSVNLRFPNRRVVANFRATWVPGFPQFCAAATAS